MKSTIRQAIEECLEAAQIHRKALGGIVAKTVKDDGDLKDVLEGLNISITKLELVLADDACDKKTAVRLMAKLNWFVKTAKNELQRTKALAKDSWKTPYSMYDQEDVVEKKVTLEMFMAVREIARATISEGCNPIDALREWASSTLASLQVISRAKPIKGVMAEVNDQNGIKIAVRAIIDYLDMGIRL